MRRSPREYRLDLKVCVGHSLFSGDWLDRLERVLAARVGPWSDGLHAWRDEAGERELVGGLAAGVRRIADEHGELYARLREKYGPGPHERRTGSVELRGGDDSLIVVVILDDYVFQPSAGRHLWGNTVAFQFCGFECCGEPAPVVCRRIAEDCCREADVLYAHGRLSAEWYAKNMLLDGGLRAIGVDMSRYLPGLYWLNWFGAPYCELMGRERLLSAPAFDAIALGDGVLLQVDERPDDWDSSDTRYARVLEHVGDRYFFLRNNPGRRTVAPDFGLEPLRRFPGAT